MTMKATYIFGASALFVSGAHAQWVVFDPSAQVRDMVNQAQTMGQWAESISNQVQQIEKLTTQIQEIQSVNNAVDLTNSTLGTYGNGGTSSLTEVFNQQQRYGNVRSLSDLTSSLNKTSSISFTGGGVFKPMANPPQMSGEDLGKYAAQEATYENYKTVAADGKSRQQQLATSKKANLEKMSAATNQADFEKYKAAAEADDQEIQNLQGQQANAAADVQAQAAITQSQNAKELEMLKKKIAEQEAAEAEANRKTQNEFDQEYWSK
jgi:hypothetical protein